MRKIIAAIILCGIAGSFAFAGKEKKSKGEGYNITVTIPNTTDTICYLAYHLGDKKYVRDTTLINKKGEFVFSGDEPLPGGIYIVYFEDKKNFEIIVNEQNFSIETFFANDSSTYIDNFKTTDSEENRVFYEYLNFTAGINKKAQPLATELGDINKTLGSDSVKIKDKEKEKLKSRKAEIETILRGFEKDIKEYRQNLFDTKADLFVVKTFRAVEEVEIPEEIEGREAKFAYYKSHFLDYVDLGDDRMMRTPIVDKKVERYLEKLTVQDPDSIIKEADYLIGRTKPNSELFKFVVITVTNKYSNPKIMCMDRVFIHMVENYYGNGKCYWADSAQIEKLVDRARTLSWTACGQQTPNLSKLQDTAGIYQELYAQPGRFMILYFWDPDCGHCKKATPKLVESYNNELKQLGVRVYAVATTKDRKKWINFINEKGMQEWINVYDPDHKSPFRQWYDITSTPKVYIVDNRKKVIARQIGVEQVSDFLKQHIKIQEEKSKNNQ